MIAGYIRVSTSKQHPENQKDEIIRYAENNKIKVDKWVVEVISGKVLIKGRKLNSLLKTMKKGDTLIVTEISRISRSLTDIMSAMVIEGIIKLPGITTYTKTLQFVVIEKHCSDYTFRIKCVLPPLRIYKIYLHVNPQVYFSQI